MKLLNDHERRTLADINQSKRQGSSFAMRGLLIFAICSTVAAIVAQFIG